MNDTIKRVRLPSGEEKLVACPELESLLKKRLAEQGPAIRKALRKCRKNNRLWWQKLIGC